METQKIEARLQQFFDQIATIQYYQRLSERIAKQTIQNLYDKDKLLATIPPEDREVFDSSLDVFSIYSPYSGENRPYSVKKSTIKDTAKLVHLHKNRQYQWLLVEAYELFEDFIVSTYELIRENNPEFRLSKDSNKELLPKDLKRKVPLILSRFREKIAGVKAIEQENKIQKNLRLYLNIIEKFRHIIVHKNGKTSNVALVVDQILKTSCLLSDKARGPNARAIINDYFGAEDHEGLIVLVEKPVFNYGRLSMHINRHDDLMNIILSHALVLSQCLVNHFHATKT
jgi:hypothetical protein